MSLPWSAGRGAVRRLGHHGLRVVVLVEGEQHRLRAGDRAEHRHHEVGEAVSVAVQGGDHKRRVRRAADQARVGRVDQDRAVGHLGMPLGGRVHLLLQHSLVDRADRPLRPAVHAPVDARGRAEAVLSHGSADVPRDPLGAEGDLVAVLLLAALLGAVGVANRHAHHGDRVVNSRHGVTPGMRRPVRMITLPSMASRRSRLGLPTSSLPSGVIVAALSPKRASRMARAALATTSLLVRRRFSRERS